MIIWIASYPKSGNTWLRSFITSLLYKDDNSNMLDKLRQIHAYPLRKDFYNLLDDFDDFEEISKNWEKGSVIESWLLKITSSELSDKSIEHLSSSVEDSGEGRWTLKESVDLGIPIPAISASLFSRFRSRQKEPISGKILSAMRRGFGGHKTGKK